MTKRVLLNVHEVAAAKFPQMYIEAALQAEGFDMEATVHMVRPAWLAPEFVLIVQDDGKA